jgi:hypothetical protein
MATPREGEAAPPVCKWAVEDAPAVELPVVSAAPVATTTVTAVTVLRLPLGRVVVDW